MEVTLLVSCCFNSLLNCPLGFHHFQAAIGKDIIDVTLIARRCNRRTGMHISFLHSEFSVLLPFVRFVRLFGVLLVFRAPSDS